MKYIKTYETHREYKKIPFKKYIVLKRKSYIIIMEVLSFLTYITGSIDNKVVTVTNKFIHYFKDNKTSKYKDNRSDMYIDALLLDITFQSNSLNKCLIYIKNEQIKYNSTKYNL